MLEQGRKWPRGQLAPMGGPNATASHPLDLHGSFDVGHRQTIDEPGALGLRQFKAPSKVYLGDAVANHPAT